MAHFLFARSAPRLLKGVHAVDLKMNARAPKRERERDTARERTLECRNERARGREPECERERVRENANTKKNTSL